MFCDFSCGQGIEITIVREKPGTGGGGTPSRLGIEGSTRGSENPVVNGGRGNGGGPQMSEFIDFSLNQLFVRVQPDGNPILAGEHNISTNATAQTREFCLKIPVEFVVISK